MRKVQCGGGDSTCSRGEEVLDFVLANGLTIKNESSKPPTFETSNGCSWIDLTITKNIEACNWDVSLEESLSDHRYIIYDIQLGKTKERLFYPRYNFKRTNWDRFVEYVLSNVNANLWDNLNTTEAVETAAQHLQHLAEEATKVSTPTRKMNNLFKSAIWWNDDLRKLKKETNKAKRLYQTQRDPNQREILKEQYRNIRRTYKNKIKEDRIESFNKYCETTWNENPWALPYKMIKMGTMNRELPTTMQRRNGSWTIDSGETHLELLQQYFPEDDNEADEETHTRIRNSEKLWRTDGEVYFSIEELVHVIYEMGETKAPGLDGLRATVARTLFELLGEFIKNLFNACLETATYPRCWKKSRVHWISKGPERDLDRFAYSRC